MSVNWHPRLFSSLGFTMFLYMSSVPYSYYIPVLVCIFETDASADMRDMVRSDRSVLSIFLVVVCLYESHCSLSSSVRFYANG